MVCSAGFSLSRLKAGLQTAAARSAGFSLSHGFGCGGWLPDYNWLLGLKMGKLDATSL